jgi:tetratricopeptide (TPR) repeat protein
MLQGDLETDYAHGLVLIEQALSLAREIEDHWLAGGTLIARADSFLNRNDLTSAYPFFEQALKEVRTSGDKRQISFGLGELGWIALAQRDAVQAETRFREALTVAQEIRDNVGAWGYHWMIVIAKIGFEDYALAKEMVAETFGFAKIGKSYLGNTFLVSAWIDLAQGNGSRAFELLEEGLTLAKQTTASPVTADLIFWLGEALRRKGDFAQAIIKYAEVLTIYQEENLPDGYCCGYFEGLGMLAIDQEQAERGARLLGVRERLRASTFGIDFLPFMVREREAHIAAALEQLGEDAFNQAWAEGKAMSTEDALKYALEGI